MSMPSTAALIDRLHQLRLLGPAQMDELPRAQAECADPLGLVHELVRRQWLTQYQAEKLLSGKDDQLLLGDYILLTPLGEGGMGQVFKARQRKLDRIVAVKIIRKERLDSPDAVRRFEREIRAAAQLDHPNVVRAIDADRFGDIHCFTMEYVEGVDLAKLVKDRGPLPVAEACDYVRQAALGLQHAHERGLIHRDIKPANLLLTAKGNIVKVLDLGLARSSAAGNSETSGSLTATGVVMGTPDYMAPEQTRNTKSIDGRADLYSLGGTLYFLLTGRVPFPGGELMEKLLRHQLDEPAPVERLRPDVPAGLARVVRKLLAKQADQRYQSAAELAAILDKGLRGEWPAAGPDDSTVCPAPGQTEDMSGVATTVDLTHPPSETKLRRRWSAKSSIMFTSVLAAALPLIGFLVLYQPEGAPNPNENPSAPVANAAGVDDPARGKNAIDLLPLIDPAKDLARGKWERHPDGGLILIADAKSPTVMEIPYRPPAAYDYHIRFTRIDGDEPVGQCLVYAQHSFCYVNGAYHNRIFGFVRVGGQWVNANQTRVNRPDALHNGRSHSSLVQVRPDGVKAFLDGGLMTEWKPEYGPLALDGDWVPRTPELLGFLSLDNKTMFHGCEVLEISGKGTFTRPDEPAARVAAKRQAAGGGSKP